MTQRWTLTIVALTTAIIAHAVEAATTVVECVAADGTVSFSAFCPPGSAKKGERRYQLSSASQWAPNAGRLPEITLFSVADCDACDLVRNVLDTRDVPYNEKNVADDADNQTELRNATGGSLSVPTILIGTNSLRGYNRGALESALNEAGYTPATPNDAPD